MVDIVAFNKNYLEQMYEVEKACFSIPWSKDAIKKDALENDISIYLLALSEDKVVGYVGMWKILTEFHITNIAVLKEYRNLGIASKLLKEVHNMAIKKEVLSITLEVRISNKEAQGLYLKNGYKFYGIRKNYYSDTKEDALIMWKYL